MKNEHGREKFRFSDAFPLCIQYSLSTRSRSMRAMAEHLPALTSIDTLNDIPLAYARPRAEQRRKHAKRFLEYCE